MISRALIALLFAAAVCAAAGRTVPDLIDKPLEPPASGILTAVPIPVTSPAGRALVRSLALDVSDAGELARANEVRLKIGTHGSSAPLTTGMLAIGSSCTFHTTARSIDDNNLLTFTRTEPCSIPPGPVGATLSLSFSTSSPMEARAALWGVSVNGPPALGIRSGGTPITAIGRRVVVRSDRRTSRATLLAFMWEIPAWSVWGLAVTGAVLVAAGIGATARTSRLALGTGTFAVVAGVATCYAILVPPLQAPDEPDHLLGYATLAARPSLALDTSAWARRIHFDRLAFASDERFTPADREHPLDRDWSASEVFAENVLLRSSTTARLWQATRAVAPLRAPHVLLFFRLLDAALLALAIAAATTLLASAGVSNPAMFGGVLLMIPTLPFFGIHMSELTFTLWAFVMGGCASLLLARVPATRSVGMVLGLAFALIAAGPRSGWPVLTVLAALCAARILLAASHPATARETAIFWAGVALPGVVLFGTRILWIPSPFYEQWQLASFDPRIGISSGQFIVGLVAGAVVGGGLELAVQRAGRGLATVASTVARAGCALALLTVIASLVWSAWSPMPILPGVESSPPASAGAYVTTVLAAWGTPARVRQFDFLTWTSLWGGFGWVNAILPVPVLTMVTIAASLACAATLLMFARAKDGRGAIVAVCAVAGMAASVAAAALSSFGLNRNVHGRYLLGSCIVGMCLLVAPSVMQAGRKIPDRVQSAALFALVCALHGYTLNFLVEKYFG